MAKLWFFTVFFLMGVMLMGANRQVASGDSEIPKDPLRHVCVEPGKSVSLVCVPPSGKDDLQLYLMEGGALPLFSITWAFRSSQYSNRTDSVTWGQLELDNKSLTINRSYRNHSGFYTCNFTYYGHNIIPKCLSEEKREERWSLPRYPDIYMPHTCFMHYQNQTSVSFQLTVSEKDTWPNRCGRQSSARRFGSNWIMAVQYLSKEKSRASVSYRDSPKRYNHTVIIPLLPSFPHLMNPFPSFEWQTYISIVSFNEGDTAVFTCGITAGNPFPGPENITWIYNVTSENKQFSLNNGATPTNYFHGSLITAKRWSFIVENITYSAWKNSNLWCIPDNTKAPVLDGTSVNYNHLTRGSLYWQWKVEVIPKVSRKEVRLEADNVTQVIEGDSVKACVVLEHKPNIFSSRYILRTYDLFSCPGKQCNATEEPSDLDGLSCEQIASSCAATWKQPLKLIEEKSESRKRFCTDVDNDWHAECGYNTPGRRLHLLFTVEHIQAPWEPIQCAVSSIDVQPLSTRPVTFLTRPKSSAPVDETSGNSFVPWWEKYDVIPVASAVFAVGAIALFLACVWWQIQRRRDKVFSTTTDGLIHMLPRKAHKQVFIDMSRNPFYRLSESSADSGLSSSPDRQLSDVDSHFSDEEYPDVAIRIETVPESDEEDIEDGGAGRYNLVAFSQYDIPKDPYWEIDRHRLKFGEVLGEGCFGVVRSGHLSHSSFTTVTTRVAVKLLKDTATDADMISLLAELSIMKLISREGHPNIANLIGCCTQDGPVHVIMEYAENGNLKDFLREARAQVKCQLLLGEGGEDMFHAPVHQPLTQHSLMHYAWQIAHGMTYIANKRIVHRDLAARNVLVCDGGRQLKISDFGLTRRMAHESDYYTKESKGRIPVKWMAPEALLSRKYSSKADVWSYGILLWEIFSLGSNPYPQVAFEDLLTLLNGGQRMSQPRNCPEHMYDIMLWCWEMDCNARPSFNVLQHYCELMLAQHKQQDVALLHPLPESIEGRVREQRPRHTTSAQMLAKTTGHPANEEETPTLHYPDIVVSTPVMPHMLPNSPDSSDCKLKYPTFPKEQPLNKTGDVTINYTKVCTTTDDSDSENEYVGPFPDPRYTEDLSTFKAAPKSSCQATEKLEDRPYVQMKKPDNDEGYLSPSRGKPDFSHVNISRNNPDSDGAQSPMLRIHSAPGELGTYENHPFYIRILPAADKNNNTTKQID